MLLLNTGKIKQISFKADKGLW